MKALENHKNALEVLRLDADAVIAHRENPFRTLFPWLFCGNWKRLQFGRDADFSIWLAKKLPGLGASVGGYRIKSVSGDGQHAHPMRIRISIQRLDLPDRARFREQARFVHGSVFC